MERSRLQEQSFTGASNSIPENHSGRLPFPQSQEKHMKSMKIWSCFLLLTLAGGVLQAQMKNAPPSIVAAMVVKVIPFEKNLSNSTDISIYVLDAPEVARELEKAIGVSVGSATLKTVESGKALPSARPSLIYCDAVSRLPEVLAYSQGNKILSTTGHPDLVNQGVTLGFGIGDDNKPKIVLNLNSSLEEGLDWNPAILKIAKIVKE